MIGRLTLAAAGIGALALPLPTGRVLVVTAVGVFGLAYSLARPGSSGPATVIGAGVLTWLATPGGDARPARLVMLAVAVSIVHAVAALLAVTPGSGRRPVSLQLRWIAWAVAAAAVGVGALGAASLLPVSASALPVTALAVVAATGGGLAVVVVVRRRMRALGAG